MKRIAVVGDSCIDLYWIGQPTGKLSAEAPVPLLKQTRTLMLPGMAGNVAKLLQDLGVVDVQLVTGSNPHFPIKNRLMAEGGQQLARWDTEDWCTPPGPGFTADIGKVDACIVCDYGKGAVSPGAVKALRAMAEEGLPLYIDTKSNPLVWAGLPSITLFPNQLEYSQWQSQYDWMPCVVHKMGAQGMRFLRYGKEVDYQPAHASSVANVCGAGDAVIAAYTAVAVVGVGLGNCLRYASESAARFVERRFDERGLPRMEKNGTNQSTTVECDQILRAVGTCMFSGLPAAADFGAASGNRADRPFPGADESVDSALVAESYTAPHYNS